MPLSEFRQKAETLRAKILKTAPMITVVNIQELLELEYGISQIGDAHVYSQTVIMSSDGEDIVIRYRFRYIDDNEYKNRFVSAKISLTNQYNSSKTKVRKEV